MDDKGMKSIKIWVRNDDVSKCDEKYHQMIQIYEKYNIFTILCAIPTVVEKECFDLIKGNDNFVLSQHGYSHKNYRKVYSLNYSVELSDYRNIGEVVSQMNDGKKKLEDLSQMPVDILTPPYNRIGKNIEKVLSNYYSTLSTFGNNISSFKNDFNPCVDIMNWKTRKFDKEHFEKKMEEKLKYLGEIGICIHHNYLSNGDILFLDDYFNNLKKDKKIILSRRLL